MFSIRFFYALLPVTFLLIHKRNWSELQFSLHIFCHHYYYHQTCTNHRTHVTMAPKIFKTRPRIIWILFWCEVSGFMVVSVKMISFWNMAPCSGEVDQRFRCVYCLGDRPDGGGKTYLWNVGSTSRRLHCVKAQKAVVFCMALYPARLSSSLFQLFVTF
jgi:hypothetical protein